MKKKLTTVDFRGTAEQEAKLLEVIAKYDGVQGKLMPILQEAQEIYGYLPIEVQKIIAEKTGTPAEQIYGVVSFYSQFKLNPDGEVAVAVCLGTACYVKGAQQIIDKFSELLGIAPGETTEDGLFTLDALRCIGACGIAPAVTINGKVYPKMAVSDVPGVVAEYKKMGGSEA